MFTLSFRSITLFVITMLLWIIGVIELVEVVSNFATEWYWLVIAVIYTVVLNELFAHLILGHPEIFEIDPTRIAFKILVFLSATSLTHGTNKSMILMHNTHHIYSDQIDKDYLSLSQRWMTSGSIAPWMYIWQPNQLNLPNLPAHINLQASRYDEILSDPWLNFCDKHQILLSLTFYAMLILLCPLVFFKIIAMGRVLISMIVLLNVYTGHSRAPFSYRHYDTNDQSHNNLISHYLTFGLYSTSLHNNHHGSNWYKSHQVKWYEVDTGAMVIHYILKPMMIKRSASSDATLNGVLK